MKSLPELYNYEGIRIYLYSVYTKQSLTILYLSYPILLFLSAIADHVQDEIAMHHLQCQTENTLFIPTTHTHNHTPCMHYSPTKHTLAKPLSAAHMATPT